VNAPGLAEEAAAPPRAQAGARVDRGAARPACVAFDDARRTLVASFWAAAVFIGLLAVGVDAGRVALAGHAPRVTAAAALGAAGLAVVVAWAFGLGGVLLRAGLVWARGPLAALACWALGLFGGVALGMAITSVRHGANPSLRAGLVTAFALGLLLNAWAAAAPASRVGRNGALMVTGAAVLLDLASPRWYYNELHDLLAVLAVTGGTALALPLAGRFVGAGPRAARLALVATGLAVLALWGLDGWVPGWRAAAEAQGVYGSAFARALREVVDLDRDGFSPIAWGNDCDDLDPRRHPHANDPPGGGDANCNGVDPPAAPTEAQRGLLPALGEPALRDGVQVLLLVTVDALRAEALRPDLMPAVWARAQRGLRFERLYAGGTRTIVSLPLITRGRKGGQTIARRLQQRGWRTVMVSSVAEPETELMHGPGLDRVVAPVRPEPDFDAATVTARTQAELDRELDPPGARPLFLWVHYYDAHTPYPPAGPDPVPVPPGLLPSYAQYAAGVRAIDAALAPLLDSLDRRPGPGRRAVLLTADHGEAFGEHGMMFHAASAFEPLVRVPGVLWAPGIDPGRYEGLAAHQDIYPTLTGVAGVFEPDDERFGRSWLRLRDPRARAQGLRRFALIRSASAVSGGQALSHLAALVEGPLKLTKSFERNVVTLTDVLDDPAERRALAPSRPADVARLERALELYRDIEGFPDDDDRADLKNIWHRSVHQFE
jgi:arylsulfatase A-like enzyme